MELQSDICLDGGKYKIVKTLGQGGFGITYLAEQTNLGRKVCIKEFFMKEYGERTASPHTDSEETVLTGVSAVTTGAAAILGRYREKFVKEARTIARLDHPGIVRIHDVFEENATAYYVMDFIEGENLNDLVKREGALPEERALGYIRQVADALSYVHGHNIMHLDIKPANILVRKSDDKAILIDFGTAKQYDSEGTQTSTTPVGLSAGYAPIEMMKPGGVQTFSPETDVYSLGATLYYLVTGQNPPDASERMEMIMEGEKFQLPNSISNSTAEVIEQSMQARKKRIQTVNGFLDLLQSDGASARQRKAEEAAAAERKRQADLKNIIKNSINQDMVSIPAGEFAMGCDSVGWLFNSNASPEESPKHTVQLSSFFISKYTVTRKVWNYVMGEVTGGPEYIPVDNVSWYEIQDFIKKLNELTGESYRLPTEAEWEYASRGGRKEKETYAGDDSIEIVGWYKDNSSSKIHPCGQKLSNGYGLYDMSGNVWEWCADGFQKYSKDFEINPFHQNEKLKVLRGGSCASEKWKCRVTCRASAAPDIKRPRYGFRLAK